MADDLTLTYRRRLYYIIAYTLMWSLCMVMLHILVNKIPQVILSEDKHLIETLGFNATDKTFHIGSHIRRSNCRLYTLDAALS